ncbi:MAG: PqqD family protein [Clostridia bacterium]|nr:PqqD family protein [Clostridia bacterium]
MKKVDDFVLREIANEYVLVPTQGAARVFDGIITFNEQAVLLWNKIDECEDAKALSKCLTDEYDVDPETALNDTQNFLNRLLEARIIKM